MPTATASSDICGPWSAAFAFVRQPPVTDYQLVLPTGDSRMMVASAPQYSFGEGDFTIQLAINVAAADIGNGWLVYRLSSDWAGNGPGFGFMLNAQGYITLITSDAQGNTAEYAPFQQANVLDGTWHNLAAVRQVSGGNTTFTIYADGQPLQGFPSEQAAVNVDASSLLIFGGPKSDGPVCRLDRLQLWARALSQTEILQNISEPPASRDKLMGEWLFNNGSPADTSGYGNTGQLQGGAKTTPK